MLTYYQMLDDRSKSELDASWEALAAAASASRTLVRRVSGSGLAREFPSDLTIRIGAALSDLTAALALSDPAGGAETLFEEAADASGAEDPGSLREAALAVVRGIEAARDELAEAASDVASIAAGIEADARSIRELADDAR